MDLANKIARNSRAFLLFFKTNATIAALGYWIFITLLSRKRLLELGEGATATEAWGSVKLIVTEIFTICFLIVFANIVYRLIRRAKNNSNYKRLFIFGVIYFAVLIILLILVWPGAYGNDDTSQLAAAQHFDLYPWQHIITSMFDNIAIACFPIASGIVILQALIAPIIVGYIATFLPTVIVRNKKHLLASQIATFFIFLLPPVLFYLMTGYRVAIYQLLEPLLFVLLFVHYREKRKFTRPETVLLVFIAILVAAWRSESIYYIVGFPALLLVTRKPLFKVKQIVCYSIILAVSTAFISLLNAAAIGDDSYSIGALVVPATAIAHEATVTGNKEDAEFYNYIYDLECSKRENHLQDPDNSFFLCKYHHHTKKDSELFKAALIKLIPKYLPSIAKYYKDILCDVVLTLKCTDLDYSGNTGDHSNIQLRWAMEYQPTDEPNYQVERRISIPLHHALSSTVRNGTINMLTGHRKNGTKKTIYYTFFYNLVFPTIALIIAIIIAIKRRNYFILICALLLFARFILVTLFSMISFTMYYMPYYISSYILLIMSFAKIDRKKSGAKKRKK
jgi:hypothetical protein